MSGWDAQTLKFYASQAREYLNQRPESVSEELPPFLEAFARGATILELGCGGGQDARFMLQRGFAVDPTDGVAAMAKEAGRLLKGRVRVMRFDELEAVERYDGVVALASLLHVPFDDLPAIVARIWRALKPGGRHIATFKTGGVRGYDEHGRYYNYLTQNEAEEIYRFSGNWSAIEINERDGIGYFSTPARWLTVIVQKVA